ncbi:MAG: NAD(P)H-hydrate dehydratase [Candidatus Omnitrophota bacterium]
MRLPAQLLQRKANAHKGDFGHVFILAGSLGMTGSAILTATACLRCGAGLVTLGIAGSLHNIFARRIVELMLKPLAETKDKTLSLKAYPQISEFLDKKADVLVIGPGLSQNKATQKLIRRIIQNCPKPMVIDADGLNALTDHLNILRTTNDERRTTILTPHPGEMSRLTGLSIAEINKNRKSVAKRVASDYNITVVLKGHNTLVADKNNIYLNKTGNPGMATAGSGDVLSGIIGAFLAQGLDAFNSAKYGVYIHGLAGDLAAHEKTQLGMIASDIIEKIPAAIKKCS